MSADEASGKTYKIKLNVSGMDRSYNNLGVHIYYDTRLEVGEIESPEGGASSEMEFHESTVNPGEIYLCGDGWWSCTNHDNRGRDGTFAEISFTLPDDAKPGDLYPIGISYMYKAPSMDYITDIYESSWCHSLKTYVFTEGIENGYIKVVGSDETVTGEVSTVKGDANLDGNVNLADAVLVMQVATNPDVYAPGKSEASITSQGEINGDVDGKKGLTNNDAILIQQFKLGLIDEL